MSYSESTFADPKPDVMDLRGEPAACETGCGADAEDYDCPCGTWCPEHHEAYCKADECFAWDFDDE